MITSKNKKVFRDKYIGKLDSLYRANSITNDFVCIDNILNCPQWDCHGGERKKPVEGETYGNVTGFRFLNGFGPCGAFTFDRSWKEMYHYPDLTEAELLALFNITMIKGLLWQESIL